MYAAYIVLYIVFTTPSTTNTHAHSCGECHQQYIENVCRRTPHEGYVFMKMYTSTDISYGGILSGDSHATSPVCTCYMDIGYIYNVMPPHTLTHSLTTVTTKVWCQKTQRHRRIKEIFLSVSTEL